MNQEIMKKIALSKMEEIWDSREMYENPEYDLAEKKMDREEKRLGQVASENEYLKRMVNDYGNACCAYTATVGEENFIRGFMEGIKFIKQFEAELEQIKK